MSPRLLHTTRHCACGRRCGPANPHSEASRLSKILAAVAPFTLYVLSETAMNSADDSIQRIRWRGSRVSDDEPCRLASDLVTSRADTNGLAKDGSDGYGNILIGSRRPPSDRKSEGHHLDCVPNGYGFAFWG